MNINGIGQNKLAFGMHRVVMKSEMTSDNIDELAKLKDTITITDSWGVLKKLNSLNFRIVGSSLKNELEVVDAIQKKYPYLAVSTVNSEALYNNHTPNYNKATTEQLVNEISELT